MLALSGPDPALGFPAGTTLKPEVFVRNTTAHPVTAHIHFDWRSASATGQTAVRNIVLPPNATQIVDVGTLQAQRVVPSDANWAAVILSGPVQPDDLMAIAASYDLTGRYGVQTPFTDQLASHWEGGTWQVDSTHDSLVAIGNGGNKQANAELTLFYNHGSQQYTIERTLAPEQEMLVDLGNLIRNQIPDQAGHVLPPDLTWGAYRIRDLADPAAGGIFEGKLIMDTTYGHAAYGCMICCGPEVPLMEWNPLGVPVGGFSNQTVLAGNSCTGIQQNVTGDFPTWWTGNKAIATATKSQINGVASGTTNHYAQSEPMYWGYKTYADPAWYPNHKLMLIRVSRNFNSTERRTILSSLVPTLMWSRPTFITFSTVPREGRSRQHRVIRPTASL